MDGVEASQQHILLCSENEDPGGPLSTPAVSLRQRTLVDGRAAGVLVSEEGKMEELNPRQPNDYRITQKFPMTEVVLAGIREWGVVPVGQEVDVIRRLVQNDERIGLNTRPEYPYTAGRKRRILAKYGPCVRCGTDHQLELHHVIPKASGGGGARSGNLIPLCYSCHMAEHGIRIARR